jgi:hypothetical protein
MDIEEDLGPLLDMHWPQAFDFDIPQHHQSNKSYGNEFGHEAEPVDRAKGVDEQIQSSRYSPAFNINETGADPLQRSN